MQEADGSLVGEVLPSDAVPVPLEVADCAGDPSAVRAALEAEYGQPFDMGTVPCMRLLVLRHGRDRATLGVNLHHSVGDGWSFRALLDDLSAAYNAAQAGRATASLPPPLPIQYSDYAAWQREVLGGGGAGAALRAYWKDRLSGCVPLLQLGTDRPRPAEPTFALGQVREQLPPELMPALRALAAQLRVSLSAIFLAAVQLVLLRFTAQDEVTIGIPTGAAAGWAGPGLRAWQAVCLALPPPHTQPPSCPLSPPCRCSWAAAGGDARAGWVPGQLGARARGAARGHHVRRACTLCVGRHG